MDLRDEFFAQVETAKNEPYKLPSGREVFAGELTGLDWVEVRLEMAKAREANDGEPDKLADARVIIRSVHDGKGSLVFKAGDEAKIMAMPGRVLEGLLALVNRVNLTDAQAQEEAKKNSPATPASPGDSPATSAS